MTHIASVAGKTAFPLEKKEIAQTFENRYWLYLMVLPLMRLLVIYVILKKKIRKLLGLSEPEINTFWFDGLGKSPKLVKKGAASWVALNEIYNYQFGKGKGIIGVVDDFWQRMINAQAVRNRLKLVKQEIKKAVSEFSWQGEVRILSLASGSAQGVIEVMAELKKRGIAVQALLLDIDPTALIYAKELACLNGVADQIEVVRVNVSRVVKVARDFKPHIIEMLGLLDYIPRDKAVKLIRKIKDSLEPNGVFLTCNICPNAEQHFMKWVINWSMIYRCPAELIGIVKEAGFDDCRLVAEPLKIHCLVVVHKSPCG